MKRIISTITAAALLMTAVAGASLADTTPQTPFAQSQQWIGQNPDEQNQTTPPAMPGQQAQGSQTQRTPAPMSGLQ